MSILIQIIENIFLLSFSAVGFYFAERYREYLGDVGTNALIGLGLGFTVALVTAVPVTLGDGATIDARAGPVILAGIVAGPVGGLLAAIMGAASRGVIGGSFAFSGIAVYFVYAMIGVVLRHFQIVTAATLSTVRSISILVFASLVGASAMFFLIRPAARALQWLQNDLPFILIANTMSVIYAAIILGAAIVLIKKSAEVIKVNERLNLARRAGKFGIWDFDLRTGKLIWDGRSKELHGVKSASFEGTFADWSKNIHPDDLKKTQELFDQALSGETVFDTEYRVMLPDGGQKSIKGDAVVVRDRSGNPIRIVGSNIDFTHIRQAEASLEDARYVAFQAQRSETIGQLTGGVAHDFNNLLAVILGSLELLKVDLKDDVARNEAIKLIDASLGAVKRGSELTHNMLAYARKAQLTPELVNLNAVVSETEKWMRRTIESSISIRPDLQAGLWPMRADKASLQSALVNLLVNARDAIDGPGTITVATRNLQVDSRNVSAKDEELSPGRYVVLTVEDSGTGIEKEALDRIFDPFFTTKTVGKGTGLGLSMVQGFVKQSRGFIDVQSELGKGSSFKLVFPAVLDEITEDFRAESKGSNAASEEKNSGRILLVEDQKQVMNVLRQILIAAGFEVVSAASGDEAFNVFNKDDQFDMVLTDIVMPGALQGPSLAKEIRKKRPDMRFVFLSGYALESGGNSEGVSDEDIRLMKPIARADLLKAIKKRLSMRL